jgi:2',3'-cyclic-nucleotide 2'-phosphodiesterase (5'-nucleotidase family)
MGIQRRIVFVGNVELPTVLHLVDMKNLASLLAILLAFIHSAHAGEDLHFRLIHTNDLHSHFEGSWVAKKDGGAKRMGHYSRLLWEISELKKEAQARGEVTLTLDAGDFYAGTVFHALGPSRETEEFPEWEFFKRSGHDAVTLGNHEFDPGNRGVETMFKKVQGGPVIVSTNLVLPNQKFSLDKVRSHFIKEIKYRNETLKVGILGLLGPDGCLVSRGTREKIKFLGFDDDSSKERWGELIDRLQEEIRLVQKETDLVILVMHAGNPEDQKLAEALKGVDLIVAGHTHQVYGHEVNGVPIVQAGQFGAQLGVLDIAYNKKEKKLKIINPISSRIKEIESEGQRDNSFDERISYFKKLAQKKLGAHTPSLDEVVITPKKNYPQSRTIGNPLGVIVTSALRDAISHAGGPRVDAYFTSMGLIRAGLFRDIPHTYADIFEMLSVGFDQKGSPGSEVVVFKLEPRDFKRVIEFMEIYSRFSRSFSPAFSDSVEYKIRAWGIPFLNRIYDVKVNGVAIEEMKEPLIVATNMFVATNVDLVEKKTYGLLKIVARDMQGEPTGPVPANLPKEFELLASELRRLNGKL